MLRLFLFSLAVVTIGILVSLYSGFPADPGYIMLAFGNYSFETSLFALLVACLVAYLLLKIVQLLLELVNPLRWIRVGRRLKRRRSSRRSRSVEGLLAVVRGNYDTALSKLSKSRQDEDASVLDYLGAAVAAFELGKRDVWLSTLEEAEREFPTARSTINSLRAQLHFRAGQLEQSMAVLEQLKRTAVNDAVLLDTLKNVYLRLEDWNKLQKLLPTLQKRKLIDKQEAEELELRVLLETLQYLHRTKDEETSALMQRTWKAADSVFRERPRAAMGYARLLLDRGLQEAAAKAIEFALSRNWDPQLIRFYGATDFGNPARQLLIAENWLKDNPANSELMLALARLSRRYQLWGKAKEYYSASLKFSPSPEAHGELGRLLQALGEEEAAERHLNAFISGTDTLLEKLPLPQPTNQLGATGAARSET